MGCSRCIAILIYCTTPGLTFDLRAAALPQHPFEGDECVLTGHTPYLVGAS